MQCPVSPLQWHWGLRVLPSSHLATPCHSLTPQPLPLLPQILQILLPLLYLLILVTEQQQLLNFVRLSYPMDLPDASKTAALLQKMPQCFLCAWLTHRQSPTPLWNLWRQFNLMVLVLHLNKVIEPLSFKYKPSFPILLFALYISRVSLSSTSVLHLLFSHSFTLRLIFSFFIFVNSSWLTPTALIYILLHLFNQSTTPLLHHHLHHSPQQSIFCSLHMLHHLQLTLHVSALHRWCSNFTLQGNHHSINLGAPNICLHTWFSICCISSISFRLHAILEFSCHRRRNNLGTYWRNLGIFRGA